MYDIMKSSAGMAFFRTQIDDNGNELVCDWSEPLSSSSCSALHSRQKQMRVKIVDYQSNIYAYKNSLRSAGAGSSSLRSNGKPNTASTSIVKNHFQPKTVRSAHDAQCYRMSAILQAQQPAAKEITQQAEAQTNLSDEEEYNGSNIVPPLDLRSTSAVFSDEYVFSGLKRDPKIAFDTWLSAKRKLLAYQQANQRQMEAEKQRQQEARKRLAKQKYELWLATKKEQAAKQKKAQATKSNANPTNKTMASTARFAHLSEEERAMRLRLWLMGKKIKRERERLLKIAIASMERHYRAERRRLADEAFRNWLIGVAHKPKPVPLNRGLYSLRGTINQLYINPNEWQSLTEEPKPAKPVKHTPHKK